MRIGVDSNTKLSYLRSKVTSDK